MSESVKAEEQSAEIAVVVLVTTSTTDDITATLNALLQQTLETSRFQVSLAFQYPAPAELKTFIDSVPSHAKYSGLQLFITQLATEHTLLQARARLLENNVCQYATFLNPGDIPEPDYLKKSILALDTAPGAAWVYTNYITQGAKVSRVTCQPFNPYHLMSIERATTYRTSPWLAAAKRLLSKHDRWLYSIDHGIRIKIMGMGHYGIPLRDTLIKLAPAARSFPTKMIMMSGYVTMRTHLLDALLIYRSARNSRAYVKSGYGENNAGPLFRILAGIIRTVAKLLTGKALERHIKYLDAFIEPKTIYQTIAHPLDFIKGFLNPEQTFSLAEALSGFYAKPKFGSPCTKPLATRQSIIFAHTNWVVGGAETVLYGWMRDARAVFNDKIVDLCERNRHGEYNETIKQAFSQVCDEQYNLYMMGNNPQQRLDIAWNILCRERPRIIVISGNSLIYALAPRIRRELKDTIIVDILHNEWHKPSDWFDVSSEYMNFINQRIVISAYWAERLAGYKERPEKIRIFPNSIDLSKFDPLRYPMPQQLKILGLPKDKIIVAFIGRLYEQKNPAVFFELAQQLSPRDEYHFIVVGDGDMREELLKEYSSLSNLTYFGLRNDVAPFLAAANILVYCSHFEGFPLASLEAAAMNKPVIAPDIVGFRDQIETGDFGLLYQQTGNKTKDAQIIATVLTEQYEILLAKSANGRTYVQAHHNENKLAACRRNYMASLIECSENLRSNAPFPAIKKKAYLHIGLQKTGTSSIQDFAFKNRDRLATHGLCYPAITDGGTANHALAWGFYKYPDKTNKRLLDLLGPSDPWRNMLYLFRPDLQLVEQDKILMSSEILPACDEEKLADYFSIFDTRVVIFLRRQDLWLESMFNQNAKTGNFSLNQPDSFLQHRKLINDFDYRATTNRWADAFGQDNIIVVPFEKSFYATGLEKNFLGLMDIPWDERYAMPGYINNSLNRDAIEYLAKVIQIPKVRLDIRHKILHILEQYSRANPDLPQHKHVYSPVQRLSLLEKYNAGNQEIARKYLGREDGILFKDSLPSLDEVWEPYPGLSTEGKARIDRFFKEYGPPGII